VLRSPVRRLLAAVAAVIVLLIAGRTASFADNIIADGDGLTPVTGQSLEFGSVACGVTTEKSVALAINRNGQGQQGQQVYANSAVVTVTVTGTTGAGLSAAAPATTITLPGNWVGSDNNVMSNVVLSTATLTSTTAGAGSGTIAYRASGAGANGGTVIRDVTLPVTWTAASCVTPSTTTVTCPTFATYTGAAQTPCTATATGTGLNVSIPVTYTANVNAGTATATATFAGDATHTGSSASATFVIDKATSSVTVTCPPSVLYTAAAQQPCTASVAGVGGLAQALPVTYTDNMAVGTAHAAATYAGDSDHSGSSGTATFAIAKAGSTITVTCDPASVTYTGGAHSPCTASATGVGLGSGVDVTASIVYTENVAAGTAHATATWAGDANHEGSTGSSTFAIVQADSTVMVSCPAGPHVYSGSAHEPCTASVTGAGGLNQPLTVTYSGNVNAGTASASAYYAGDANHTSSNASATFQIDKAPSTVTVTCTPDSVTFTGAAHTPCSAGVSGAGGLAQTLAVSYTDNTNAGTATAAAEYAGDANHIGSNGHATFTIEKASSAVALNCPTEVVYTGTAQTPCSATAEGAGTIDASVPVELHYVGNVGAGTASVQANWPGDGNHQPSANSTTFEITQAPSTVTVSCPGSVVYTGSALEPCTTTVAGAGLTPGGPLAVPVVFAYTNNTVAGTASVTAIWDGDANHTGDADQTNFVITKAPSAVAVTCSPSSVTYTGTAQTPCTASVSGAGGLTGSLPVAYADNVAAGTATASAEFAGDANHLASTGQATFTITKATSSVVVTCPASVVFTGSAQTPCTATVTGAGGLNQSVSPVDYSNSTLVGTAFASATYAGDANHSGTTGSASFQILAWTLKGYYQPVDMNTATTTVWNTVKNGSTVPLKFEAFAGANEIVTTTALQATFTVTGVSCPGSNAVTDDIELTTTGGTSFRYDTSAGQFIQNWQTPKKAGACYTVTTTTLDGSKLSAWFILK
jgi:hypothetical protein